MAYIYEVGDVVKMKKKHFQNCSKMAVLLYFYMGIMN